MKRSDLPDPRDRSLAWWNGEPACLAWWRAIVKPESEPQWHLVRALKHLYSYSIPTIGALEEVAGLGPLVELGAGAGYWARLLRDRGVDIIAYDIAGPSTNSWTADEPTWTDVQSGNERVLAAHADRAMLVAWPERPGVMPTVLRRYAPQTLALITDGRISIQQTDPLFDRLEAGWTLSTVMEIPQWPGCFDRLTVWERKVKPAGRGGHRLPLADPPQTQQQSKGLRLEHDD